VLQVLLRRDRRGTRPLCPRGRARGPSRPLGSEARRRESRLRPRETTAGAGSRGRGDEGTRRGDEARGPQVVALGFSPTFARLAEVGGPAWPPPALSHAASEPLTNIVRGWPKLGDLAQSFD
jgi:hypothetical protein